ncbi:MFS transporter [Cupriavidus basilensis]
MPVAERGFAQGITHSFAQLGGAITPPIVLAIVATAGWREAFIVLGAISLGWTLLYHRVQGLARPAQARDAAGTAGDRLPARRMPALGQAATPWRRLFRRMWLVTFVDFCYGWSLWVYLTWLPSYLKEARGFDLKQLALFTALPLMAGVVGDTLGGVLSDRIYKRTGNLRLARGAILFLGLAGSLMFIVPMTYTADAVNAVILLSLSFFFLELTNAVLWSLPLDIAGKYAGTAGGMMNTGFGLAGMISPVAFGYLIETTGSCNLPFMISAALLGVGAIAALFINPLKTVDTPEEKAAEVRPAFP